MSRFRFAVSTFAVLMILSLSFTSAGAIPKANEGTGADFVWVEPMPYYPYEETIFDKTPEFRFSQYEAVTRYRIKVRNYEDQNIEYYTYKGTATCEDFECWMTPDIPLAGGVVTYQQPLKGYYEWTVEAKVAPGVWSGVQAYVPFGLGTTGFNSQFTIDKKGWLDRNGEWTLTSVGYLKNIGMAGEYTSALFKKRIYEDFTVEAKIKLKSATTYELDDLNRHYGGIILFGNGTLNTEPDYPSELNAWRKGIFIVFRNNQQAAIFIYDGGANIGGIGWKDCSSIVADGWNTIKATEADGMLTVYINGIEWETLSHPFGDDSGYVGLTQYRYAAETEKMLVDWVTLAVDTP